MLNFISIFSEPRKTAGGKRSNTFSWWKTQREEKFAKTREDWYTSTNEEDIIDKQEFLETELNLLKMILQLDLCLTTKPTMVNLLVQQKLPQLQLRERLVLIAMDSHQKPWGQSYMNNLDTLNKSSLPLTIYRAQAPLSRTRHGPWLGQRLWYRLCRTFDVRQRKLCPKSNSHSTVPSSYLC